MAIKTIKTIEIYRDEQDQANIGWAYRITDGSSGAIDGSAAQAVDAIVEGIEAAADDRDELLETIEWAYGDRVSIVGPGLPGDLGEALDILRPAPYPRGYGPETAYYHLDGPAEQVVRNLQQLIDDCEDHGTPEAAALVAEAKTYLAERT